MHRTFMRIPLMFPRWALTVLSWKNGPYIRERHHIGISTYHLVCIANLYMPVKISENANPDSE